MRSDTFCEVRHKTDTKRLSRESPRSTLPLACGSPVDGIPMDAANLREEATLDEPAEILRLVPADIGGEVEMPTVLRERIGMVVAVDVHAEAESCDRLMGEEDLLGDEERALVDLIEMFLEVAPPLVVVPHDEHLVAAELIHIGRVTDIAEMDEGVRLVARLLEDRYLLFCGNPVRIHELAIRIVEMRVADDVDRPSVGPTLECIVECGDHLGSLPTRSCRCCFEFYHKQTDKQINYTRTTQETASQLRSSCYSSSNNRRSSLRSLLRL